VACLPARFVRALFEATIVQILAWHLCVNFVNQALVNTQRADLSGIERVTGAGSTSVLRTFETGAETAALWLKAPDVDRQQSEDVLLA